MNRLVQTISLLVVLLVVASAYYIAAIRGWNQFFDDSFISYRYALNAAQGHGITWNVGEAPTEGYTNFLLVLVLIPFLKAGCDPLLVTRVLSYAAALAMAGVVFGVARHRYGTSRFVAFLAGAYVLLYPTTRELCLVGLETVIYSLFLLLACVTGARFLEVRTPRTGLVCMGLLTLAVLLRPEAVLVWAVIAGLFCLPRLRDGKLELKPLVLATLLPAVVGGLYLVWKQIHFGALLPNPFYIKAGHSSLINGEGVYSVSVFLQTAAVPVALAGIALVCAPRDRLVWMMVATSAVMALFFCRTETIMDIQNRFLFPLMPLLVCGATLVLSRVVAKMEERVRGHWAVSGLCAFALLALTWPNFITEPYWLVRGRIKPAPRASYATTSLMQKEYRMALRLAEFPDIRNIRMAFGDAGVIPYFTGCQWLDTLGLNDTIVARARSAAEVNDRVFSWMPDVIIQCIHDDPRYANGIPHVSDARWEGYDYVGTCRTSYYDLHFMLRRDSPRRQAFAEFLEKRILDGRYDSAPVQMGAKLPPVGLSWRPNTQLTLD